VGVLDHPRFGFGIGYDAATESGLIERDSATFPIVPAFPIFAESETLFFYKVVEATLEFRTDASGAVKAVRLHQEPIDSVAPRK
jgi:hypothetical protein